MLKMLGSGNFRGNDLTLRHALRRHRSRRLLLLHRLSALLHGLRFHLLKLRQKARQECPDHAVAPLLKSIPHALLAQSFWKGALPFPQTGHFQPAGP
jgi:hypothetical protein